MTEANIKKKNLEQFEKKENSTNFQDLIGVQEITVNETSVTGPSCAFNSETEVVNEEENNNNDSNRSFEDLLLQNISTIVQNVFSLL